MVTKLNRMMNGWANYFCLGPVSKAYRAVDQHAGKRLRQWLCGKAQRGKAGDQKYSDAYPARQAWSGPAYRADAQLFVGETVMFLREPDALIAPVRFDERDVETEHGRASEAPANERAGNR